jgi:RNA polymerase sigma-70 factor, ECF subfamily
VAPKQGVRRRSDRAARVLYLDGPPEPRRPSRRSRGERAGLADRQLLVRIVSGDQRALAGLYDRHGPAAYGLALSVCGGERSVAEDAVEAAFVSLWRNPEAFDATTGSLSTHLLAAVHRTASTAARQGGGTPSGDRSSKEALLRLPAAQREAVVLAYFGGQTAREVADHLGIAVDEARVRIRDGMAGLRAQREAGGQA